MDHLVRIEDEGMGVANLEPPIRFVNCTREQVEGNAGSAPQPAISCEKTCQDRPGGAAGAVDPDEFPL